MVAGRTYHPVCLVVTTPSRLITADNLITGARNLGPNAVDLLVRYGLIATDDVVEYTNEIRQPLRRKLPRVDLKGPSI